MAKLKGLKCRECKREYPIEPIHVCEFCFGPLEVNYDYDYIKSTISKESISKGPKSLWRYIDLLPVENPTVGLTAGFTPLKKADKLGKILGLNNLYIKDDSVNHPTLSFKDRVVSVALSKAKEFGFDTGACASTGNLANSVAAHCAQSDLNCYVFIPANLESQKIIGSLVFNPTVVAVNGNYDDVNRLCSEIANDLGWAFVNINIRPYYAEGSKTLAFETIEQLGWIAPDAIVAPAASGSLITKIYKGIEEFYKVGLIDKYNTRVYGAQALGCSPIAQAFKEGLDFVKPVKPNTIAKSIAIGNPADGIYALDVVRKTGGIWETADDNEIIEGMKLLAQTEGIFTETAGGTTIAVLKKLAQQGQFKPDEIVVAYITGNGYKTMEVLEGKLSETIHINPTLKEFKEVVLKRTKGV
ncbi:MULTISPECIES: threonine synthase [unclassified Hydrogenobaculum]|jgi:threonine synthase|uniref:threonine synthase n=1 Tax=unclassified Hydrogenobaculum TaxID=2622382 RepID=UPI0001C515EF|nr:MULTISPECIES: threonine synthase [unclassified Hydrogenobaculum]AEF19013.1 threonine synthase [Hydrogenobaculum sp. 3684]AEG46300.1 threonine synthase [Hydrogenobaculum sp. SHO]AGG14945.1 threonine synthase [Hydrogenobaculum sp. HO]AGH93241.1 threonine synthase [Hydrogenobaculum sp. SN]